MRQETNKLGRNVVWGLTNGMGFGLGFFAIAGVIYLITGGRAFEANGISVAAAFIVYLGGGAMAGAIVGVFRDVPKGPVGKVLVAVLAATPVSFVGLYALEGGDWRSIDLPVVAIGALLFGLGAAGVFWDDY